MNSEQLVTLSDEALDSVAGGGSIHIDFDLGGIFRAAGAIAGAVVGAASTIVGAVGELIPKVEIKL